MLQNLSSAAVVIGALRVICVKRDSCQRLTKALLQTILQEHHFKIVLLPSCNIKMGCAL